MLSLKVKLRRREEEVLYLIACGHQNKQIAHTLGIAEGSVTICCQRIARRMGLNFFDRGVIPGLCLLLGIVSIADVTRGALDLPIWNEAPKEGAQS